ncbi:MAG: SdrD B-like domain-containing protein, partial [Thermoguttaceae bacterium]
VNLSALTATRTDVLAAGSSYPPLTLTVSVAGNAPASVTNAVTVSGGGEVNAANDTASDPTTIVQVPDLTVTKTHAGNFTQGDTADTYTITVSNVGGAPTSGAVSLADTLPTGLTATALSGTGWTVELSALTATRSDALAGGASYPPLTLTVSVAGNAPASVTNTVTVSGGGEVNTANDTASDTATVQVPGTSLSGVVYIDADNDGKDAIVNGQRFHVGIPDVTITLTGTDTSGNAVNKVLLTASDGSYYFGNLAAGTYEIQETPPMKYLPGIDSAGSLGGTVPATTGGAITGISLPANEQGTNYNFGHRGLALPYVSDALALTSTPSPAEVVQELDDPPVVKLDGAGGTNDAVTLPSGGGPVPVANTTAATVTKADGGWLGSLTVTITDLKDGGNESLLVDKVVPATSPSPLSDYPNISAAYDNGVLMLSGPASAADYQAVLRTVEYSDTASLPDPTPRTITFVASDPIHNSQAATTTVTMPGSATVANAAQLSQSTAPVSNALDQALTDQVLATHKDWLNL